jgi:hypothetical protein
MTIRQLIPYFSLPPSLPSPTGEGVKTFTFDRKMKLINYSEIKIISPLGETGKGVDRKC